MKTLLMFCVCIKCLSDRCALNIRLHISIHADRGTYFYADRGSIFLFMPFTLIIA